MNKNILIVLGGAVVVAVLVAVLVQVMVGGKPEVVVASQAEVEILVAAQDLKIGGEIGAGDVRWQAWPENSLFAGVVRRDGDEKAVDALEGRLARNVSKDEPLMRSALLLTDKGNLVAARLEPGMRAMAIDVKAASMVAGFIGPGDFVDVILTYKESVKADADEDPRIKAMIEMNLDKMATETILQNVKVLAVDQQAKRSEEGEKIKVAKTVTLAIGAQDAEKLALAGDLGELDLVLRGVGDDVVVEKKWPTISDARLTSMADEIFAEYEVMKKDTGIRPDIVRIYSGNSVQTVSAH